MPVRILGIIFGIIALLGFVAALFRDGWIMASMACASFPDNHVDWSVHILPGGTPHNCRIHMACTFDFGKDEFRSIWRSRGRVGIRIRIERSAYWKGVNGLLLEDRGQPACSNLSAIVWSIISGKSGERAQVSVALAPFVHGSLRGRQEQNGSFTPTHVSYSRSRCQLQAGA